MSAALGTEVTCRDLATGETETRTIRNDFMVVTDGVYVIEHIATYATGTVVVTLKPSGEVNR